MLSNTIRVVDTVDTAFISTCMYIVQQTEKIALT